jgi:hypothetical protein
MTVALAPDDLAFFSLNPEGEGLHHFDVVCEGSDHAVDQRKE